jgi:hypothetical protein
MSHQIVGAIALSMACALGAPTAAWPQASQTTKPAQAQDPAKAEALSAAVRRGDLAAVKQLLDAGVDVNTKFRYDATALAFAADRGFADIVKLLIERGADVNAKDTFYDATPLTWAASPAMARTPGHAEVVRLLLKAGAKGADQALMSAAEEKDAPMVKAILENGGLADKTLSDALEAAKTGKATDIVNLLEAAGAEPPKEITLTAGQLARYEGTYESPRGSIVVKVVSGRLQLDVSRLGGPPDLALSPRSETEFAAPAAGGLTATFQIQDNKVTAVSIAGQQFKRGGGQ